MSVPGVAYLTGDLYVSRLGTCQWEIGRRGIDRCNGAEENDLHADHG
jgi:hypothetical protein